MKVACVTGHRMIPAHKTEYVIRELRREIKQAISDGYTVFISGFAEGADLIFAGIIAEVKKTNPDISLEAAIPYRERIYANDPKFQRLIKKCDKKYIICEDYSRDCYAKRNSYLVSRAQRVIAVFDGRSRSGTAQTIRMAQQEQREIRIISI